MLKHNIHSFLQEVFPKIKNMLNADEKIDNKICQVFDAVNAILFSPLPFGLKQDLANNQGICRKWQAVET